MVIHISKTFLMALGAIALVVVGALGMWAINKATTLAAPMMAPTAEVAVAPAQAATAAATTAATVAAPVVAVQSTPVAVSEDAAPPGYVLAQVISVQPHYVMQTVPFRSCHMEPRTVFVQGNGPSGVGAVLGGVAGGLAGNQIGGGRGKIAATIGGSILGAVVGNQVEDNMSQPQPRTVMVRVCHRDYTRQSVRSGYEVSYFYKGQKGMLVMKHAPTEGVVPIPVTS